MLLAAMRGYGAQAQAAREGGGIVRLGWHVHLLGPFSVGGTIWRSKARRRGPAYHGTLPGWKCAHNHSRPDLAQACAQREARRRLQ